MCIYTYIFIAKGTLSKCIYSKKTGNLYGTEKRGKAKNPSRDLPLL